MMMALVFVAALPMMHTFIDRYDPPFIAKLYRDGRIRLLSLRQPEGN